MRLLTNHPSPRGRDALVVVLAWAAPCLGAHTDGPSPFEALESVTITSVTKTAEDSFTVAADAHVLSDEAIRRSGAFSLPDVLRGVPGTEVASINNRTQAVTIRGFNGTSANKLLPLVDGRSLYSQRFGGTIWDIRDIPLADVEQIEVIGGPGGTAWGSNAVNGIINVITKSARATQGTLASATAGTGGDALLYARHGFSLGHTQWMRVYLHAAQRPDSLPVPPLRDANDAWNTARVGLRYDREPDAVTHTTVTADAFAARADILTGSPLSPQVADSHGWHILGRHIQAVGEGTSTLQVWYDAFRRELGVNQSEADVLDAEVRHAFPVGGAHEFLVGINARASRLRDRVSGPGVSSAFQPEVRWFEQGSLFVQDAWSPADTDLRLTAGTKLELNEFTGPAFLPSVRAAWTPGSWTLWGAYSRATRLPSRFEREQATRQQFGASTLEALPNPELDAEEMDAFELGVRWRDENHLRLDANVFWHTYTDLVVGSTTVVDPFLTRSQSVNGGSAETFGCGVEAVWTPVEGLDVSASWDHVDIRVTSDPGVVDVAFERIPTLTPRNQVRLGVRWDWEGWEVDARARWVDELPTPGRHVPDYIAVDARVGRQLGAGWEVALIGRNLTDGAHPEFIFFTSQANEVERAVLLRIDWYH